MVNLVLVNHTFKIILRSTDSCNWSDIKRLVLIYKTTKLIILWTNKRLINFYKLNDFKAKFTLTIIIIIINIRMGNATSL